MVEVMTDKATVEIPAPAAGTMLELRAQAGDVVDVGSVIFVLETAGAPAAAPAPRPVAAAAAVAAPGTGADTGRGSSNGKVLAVPSARRVARELGIDLSQVSGTGRNGVVRRADVEAFAKGRQTAPAAAAPAAPARRPLPRRGPSLRWR